MKRFSLLKFFAAALVSVFSLSIFSGCVTGGTSILAVKDPESILGESSAVHIDALRDTEIAHRNQMRVAPEIAREAGLNVVTIEDADFVMYLNFRQGLRYNSSRGEFERRVSVSETRTSVRVQSAPGKKFGVINAGVFPLGGALGRTAWEASVEVEDIEDPDEVRHSLRILFEVFGEDFRGQVPGTRSR